MHTISSRRTRAARVSAYLPALALTAAFAGSALLAACGSNDASSAGPPPRAFAAAGARAGATKADYTPLLQRVYLAYFGRPADPAGLDYYAAAFVQAGVPTDLAGMLAAYGSNSVVKSTIDGFGTSAESQALYPGDNGTFVTAVYANLFGRAPDAAGKAYWVAGLDAGAITRGNAAAAIMNGAQSTDAAIVANKAQVASNFTAALNTSARSDSYDGLTANAAVRALLAQVGAGTDTAAFQANIEAAIASLAAGPSAPGIYRLAGSAGGGGALDGHGSAARFQFTNAQSAGGVTDAAGNLYVADILNGQVRKITPAGDVSTVAGVAGVAGVVGRRDGPGAQAVFTALRGITIDPAGNLYVVDDATIRRITPAGDVTTFAGQVDPPPDAAGNPSPIRLSQPEGICSDAAGNIYFVDAFDQVVRKITPDGTVSLLAGTMLRSGLVDGPGATAKFSVPWGITSDAQGTLYVTDRANRAVRRISTSGIVSTVAGGAGAPDVRDGIGTDARFHNPVGIVAVGADTLYITDANTIRKISGVNGTAAAVSTLNGRLLSTRDIDGAAAVAQFAATDSISADSAGTLFVVSKETVRRVAPDGSVSTLAGMAAETGITDGAGSRARFGYLYNGGALAATAGGNVLVADNDNATLRLITPAGTVSTIAGLAGAHAVVDGPVGGSARFKSLLGVARAGDGTIFVSDDAVVRQIGADGMVSTVAGLAGVHATFDGIGAAARFGTLNGMVTDAAGTLYVLDCQSGSTAVRKITRRASVSTLARLVDANITGCAEGLAIDGDGNLYVAVADSHVIVKVTPGGQVRVLAGALREAANAIDGASTVARFNAPGGIVYDPAGMLLVMEAGTGLLRQVTLDGTVSTVAGTRGRSGVATSNALPGSLPLGWGIAYVAPHRYVIAADAGLTTVILP